MQSEVTRHSSPLARTTAPPPLRAKHCDGNRPTLHLQLAHAVLEYVFPPMTRSILCTSKNMVASGEYFWGALRQATSSSTSGTQAAADRTHSWTCTSPRSARPSSSTSGCSSMSLKLACATSPTRTRKTNPPTPKTPNPYPRKPVPLRTGMVTP